MKVRNLSEKELADVLAINNSNLPAVSKLDMHSLSKLCQQAQNAWVIEDSKASAVAGFCLVIPPGVDYTSENYRWVGSHYSNFQYLDRIVISEKYRGQGLGKQLYEHWFAQTTAQNLLLEVNIKPMNEGSLLFHEKMGFQGVGEQDVEGGKKRVKYMIKAKK